MLTLVKVWVVSATVKQWPATCSLHHPLNIVELSLTMFKFPTRFPVCNKNVCKFLTGETCMNKWVDVVRMTIIFKVE